MGLVEESGKLGDFYCNWNVPCKISEWNVNVESIGDLVVRSKLEILSSPASCLCRRSPQAFSWAEPTPLSIEPS